MEEAARVFPSMPKPCWSTVPGDQQQGNADTKDEIDAAGKRPEKVSGKRIIAGCIVVCVSRANGVGEQSIKDRCKDG